MKLSENFTLEELTYSKTALSHGISNKPSETAVEHLKTLCKTLLQPVRDAIGRPLYINSGYRSKPLNSLVGGAKNSYHLFGMAADIHVDTLTEAKALSNIFLSNKSCDLAIIEVKNKTIWLHVQYSEYPRHKLLYRYL